MADLIGAFDDYKEAGGEAQDFTGRSELTMFADYRVPQILRHIGVFIYSIELAK